MSILKSAELIGVWGERDMRLKFYPDVNFLIGANGSGKTTIINLIAAMLNADYEALLKIPFTSISCELILTEQDSRPCFVSATRTGKSEILGRSTFHYVIIGNSDPTEFDLNDLRYLVQRKMSAPVADGPEILKQLVRLKWLSVHRSTLVKPRDVEQAAGEPSVDRRLTQLSNLLVRYFSKLAAKRDDETSAFLKRFFPILVSQSSEDDVFNQGKKINLPVLRESINELISELHLGGRSLERNLETHFRLAESAIAKDSYSSSELTALMASLTMQKVVAEWNRSLVRQGAISKPRREFLEIINSMFVGKQLVINQRNELEAVLPNEKHLPLSELSSGEKQLLVIMAEALLQEGAQFIYIADEPELSLHVRWQEQLTRNLRIINPQAQVIFATHSPDIVSEYANRAIDVERLG